MICLSWNYQGFGNPHIVHELPYLVSVKGPNFVFLIETKCNRNKVENIMNKIGFQLSFVVDSKGISGGLAFLWKDNMDVELSTYTKSHISLNVTLPNLGNKVLLTSFYGSPEASKRIGYWNLLRVLKPQDARAWLCMRDFNEILHQHEK